ncbi:MAG TPA: GNAT family N-acetyltransferase [Pseudonocardiaceae bacterium]|nr:GNAT family N-acetyltransferase [Pseudonocardiaceae bacterium]
MEIRAAQAGELAAVLALAVAFYAEDGFTTPETRLRTHLQALLRTPAARVAVASEGTALLGFAVTTTSFGLENGLIAELEDLYVVPSARRRGVARGLIDDSVQWAGALGCAQLELVVAPNGHDASSLLDYYRRRGFHDEGRLLLAHRLTGDSRDLERRG